MVVVSNYMVSSTEVEPQHAQHFFQLLKEAYKHLPNMMLFQLFS